MEIKGGMGSLAGLPVRGGTVALSGADVSQLVAGFGGVVRSAAKAGGIGLGAALLLAALGGNSIERERLRRLLPMSGLVKIKAYGSEFWGFLEEEELAFSPAGDQRQMLRVPLYKLCSITPRGSTKGSFKGYDLQLIDGSRYYAALIRNFRLRIITPVGFQTLPFFEPTRVEWDRNAFFGLGFWKLRFSRYDPKKAFHSCEGVLPEDVSALSRQIRNALQMSRPRIIQELGRDLVSEFFNLKDV